MITHPETLETLCPDGGSSSTVGILSRTLGVYRPSLNYKGVLHSKINPSLQSVVVLDARAPYSVSSVKTLEDAKVAPGCLYMGMPVQEVCTFLHRPFS